MRYLRRPLFWLAGLSLLYLVLWRAWVWSVAQSPSAETVQQLGLAGLFVMGLGWLVWALERTTQWIEGRRLRDQPLLARRVLIAGEALQPSDAPRGWFGGRSWNPLDPAAWYYGKHSQRLKQSLAALTFYSLAFLCAHLLLGERKASGDSGMRPYEMPPGGGGGQPAAPRAVRIQKVIAPKFVINPYSSIVIAVPPIDTVSLKMMEETRGMYVAGQGGQGMGAGGGTGRGYGSGSGFGFGSGKGKGQVRFIRLKHSDRSSVKNFGIGGDMNLLNYLVSKGVPREAVARATEICEVTQLASFPPLKCPPVVYVGGSQTFLLTTSEKRILREYLLDRHGMVLGDNLGGAGFHNHFIAVMNEVTGVQAVTIPRDDDIHRRPYSLPELPFVVAHGGTVPLGWKVDGRWVAYYHPGALSDAWRDDRAGIRREIAEACYQLGVNILLYAHEEAEKWRQSQQR